MAKILMAVLAIITIISYVSAETDDEMEQLQKNAIKQCRILHNITEEGLRDHQLEENPPDNFKCYQKCFYEQSGYLVNNALSLPAMLRSQHSGQKSLFERIHRVCSGQYPVIDNCNNAYSMHLCLNNEFRKGLEEY